MTTAIGAHLPPSAASLAARIARIAACAALLLYFFGSVWAILEDPDLQTDALLRHYAVGAWHAGLNPYAPAELSRLAGTTFDTAYIYPPDTLPVFAVFSRRGLDGVRPLFLGFQVLLLTALIACWQRFFLDAVDRFQPLFFVLCLAGFGNSLLTDLRVGNISLLEQTLLWWGLAAWLHGRYRLFAALLWMAAACKLTLLAFSVLLLLSPVRRWGLFSGLWLTMIARLGLDRWSSPVLFHDFTNALVGGFGGAHDGGRNNPCAVELLKSLVQVFHPSVESPQVAMIAAPLYVLLILVVLGVSFAAWRVVCRPPDAGPANPPDPRRAQWLIFLVCLAYTLTVPRMKDYSYILLLPVGWQVAKWTLGRSPRAWLVFVVLACLSNYSYVPSLQACYGLIWDYLPYLLALAAWLLLLVKLMRSSLGNSSA